MGSMHSCHLNPPYPSFTRISTARTHSHTHLLSQSPGMPQTRHVLEHRRGLGKCSIFFQLCPWKVSKVLSNWRQTVPIMLLHQGCPWESQQKGPSWPHLQHAVMFMAWTETFLVRAKCQVCILAGFLKENFPDQTSDLGKPSLQQIHKIESNPSRVMGFAVSETYQLHMAGFWILCTARIVVQPKKLQCCSVFICFVNVLMQTGSDTQMQSGQQLSRH